MQIDRFKQVVAIFLLLVKDNKVFLLRRFNTGWEDGTYCLIGGHVEDNESVTNTVVREAQEETGIHVNSNDLKFFNLTHLITNDIRIHIAFTADKWKGKPKNNEPEKSDHADWFPLDNLPDNINYVAKEVINCYINNTHYFELGWKDNKKS